MIPDDRLLTKTSNSTLKPYEITRMKSFEKNQYIKSVTKWKENDQNECPS